MANTELSSNEDALPGGKGKSCRTCPVGGVTWPAGCPSEERSHAAGTVLIEQGVVPAATLLVKAGLVGLSCVDESGGEVGCTVRGAPSLLGFEGLVGAKSAYRVWALTDVLVCEANVSRLEKWTGTLDTPLGAILRLGFAEAHLRGTERLDFGGAAVTRIARLLLRRCVDQEQPRLLLSQRLLARVLSMTPETVSRALAKLHAGGAVACTRPVIVGDPEALRRFAQDPKCAATSGDAEAALGTDSNGYLGDADGCN